MVNIITPRFHISSSQGQHLEQTCSTFRMKNVEAIYPKYLMSSFEVLILKHKIYSCQISLCQINYQQHSGLYGFKNKFTIWEKIAFEV